MTTHVDYHSDFATISKTMLALFCKSPVEFYMTYVTRELPPWTPTKPAILGTLAHACLLESKEVDDLVAIYPDSCLTSDGKLNWRKAPSFEADNPGRHCLKYDDVEPIRELVEAMRGSSLGAALALASHMEHRFDAHVHGLDCRCKPDILCDMSDHVLVYDLKFMKDVSPDAWRRSSHRLMYWLQDAHYSKIIAKKFDKPVVFRFFACETKKPYRVQPYWFDRRSREIAFETHERKLGELLECTKSQKWDDNWQSECQLNVWDVSEEDQLVEFGEEE